MARRTRLFIRDMPYHVIQRGNNRNSIFFCENDYSFFLSVLQEAKMKHPCFIYSYCLMPNHFHLLIQPREKDNISLLMKLLGAKYVHYVNKYYNRTGTLWEGRFKCSLIDQEPYFYTCLHYIEMNPLRAGIVNSPELYRWSSYRVRAFGEKSLLVDTDPWYNSLGSDKESRGANYRRLFRNLIPEATLKLIRETTNRGVLLGREGFKEKIESAINKEIVIRQPGRPRKEKNNSDPVFTFLT